MSYTEYRRDLSNGTDEWYTPKKYLDAVREVLSTIDLDPASCITANKNVLAKKIFTIEDDGLNQSWRCQAETKVFCNPPYGKATKLWIRKLISEFESGAVHEAILLVNSNTSSSWFKPLWDYPICLTDHRIKFVSGEDFTEPDEIILPETGIKKKKHQPTSGNAFVYFGKNIQKFKEVFQKFGAVVVKL